MFLATLTHSSLVSLFPSFAPNLTDTDSSELETCSDYLGAEDR
jgi:hypothetical protein